MASNQVYSEDNTSDTSSQTQPPEVSSQTPPTQVEESKDHVTVNSEEQIDKEEFLSEQRDEERKYEVDASEKQPEVKLIESEPQQALKLQDQKHGPESITESQTQKGQSYLNAGDHTTENQKDEQLLKSKDQVRSDLLLNNASASTEAQTPIEKYASSSKFESPLSHSKTIENSQNEESKHGNGFFRDFEATSNQSNPTIQRPADNQSGQPPKLIKSQSVPFSNNEQTAHYVFYSQNSQPTPIQLKPEELDLAFLHADPYVLDEDGNETVATLSPDIAFKKLKTELGSNKKQFNVLESHLNLSTLRETLEKRPKILVLYCHGDKEANFSHFYFEQKEKPSLVYKHEQQLLQQDLKELFQNDEESKELCSSIKLVIVSACHSSWLAEKFVDAGIKSVIGISASTPVEEKAAQYFNACLIGELVKGKTVEKAFNIARKEVSNKTRVCCCYHEHSDDCLWERYIKDNGLNDEKGHSLHDTDCDKTCKEKQFHDEGCQLRGGAVKFGQNFGHPCKCPPKKINYHKHDCKVYEDFYAKLAGYRPFNKEKSDQIQKLVDKGITGFIKMPTDDSNQPNIMCCCKSHWDHDESLKFVLKQETDNWDRGDPIFKTGSLREGTVTEINLKEDLENNRLKWKPVNDLFWLYGRNKYIHQIVDFIFAKEPDSTSDFPQFLAVASSSTLINLETVIKQSVFFSIGRDTDFDGNRFLQVDLGDNIDFETTLRKISDALALCNPELASKAGTIADLSLLRNCHLLYLSQCKQLDERQGNFFKEIVDTTRNLKVILAVKGQTSSLDKNRPTKFQSVEIGLLSQKERQKFFKDLLARREIKMTTKGEQELKIDKRFIEFNETHLKLFSEKIKKGSLSEIKELIAEISSLQEEEKEEQKQAQQARELQEQQALQQRIAGEDSNDRVLWKHRLDSIPSNAEKNIVFLLNMFPEGLTELELRKLCQEYPNWFGQYEELKILGQGTGEQVEELRYRELISPRPLNYDVKQLCYQINRQSRDTVANKFDDPKTSIQYCDDEDEKDHNTKELKLIAIEFANQQARSYLLSNLQGERIDNHQNYQLATVHQDCEMWRSPKYGKRKPGTIEQPIERFNEYMRQNLENFIDKEKWLQPFEGKVKTKKNVDELLSDLSLVLLSIEIELHHRNLDHLTTKVDKYLALNNHSKDLLYYQLRLMYVSISVRKNEIDSKDLLLKLSEARKGFKDWKPSLSKSLAETYLLEAFIGIKILGKTDDNEANKKINDLFDSAYELYREETKETKSNHEDTFACDSEFGQAKLLLEQTKFFLLKSSFDQEKFQTQIAKAKEAERIFKERKRPDLEAMSIIQQVKLLLRWSKEVEESSQNSVRQAESTLSKALDIQRDRLINDQSIEEEIKKTEGDVKTSQGKAIICILDQPGNITVEETQITDYRDSNRHWIEQLIGQFRNNKFNGRIIYDIISKRSLRKAIHFGAKILHLEQFVPKLDHLLVEDASGRLCQLDVDQILKMIGADGGSEQSSNGDGQDSDFEKTLKHTFDCLVLAFPQSQTLAHLFQKLGVNHVVYFESKEGSVPNDELTFVAIQKFCLKFYQKLLEEFSVKAAFDDAISNSETKSVLQPVLLERDSEIHLKKLFESSPTDFNTDLILEGQIHDLSFERCPFTNINMRFERLNGQQLELHEVLMFLTNKEVAQPTLFHVQDDRDQDGPSFLKEVAYCTLERDMIQRQIYYEDLSQIRTQQQMKNMLLRLHLSNNESELFKTYRQIQPVETLLLFENLGKLPPRLVEGFEIRLVNLLQKYKGIRCLTLSKEQFSFKQFTNPNEPDPSNKKENYERLNCQRLVIQSAKRYPIIRIDLLNPSPNQEHEYDLIKDAEPENSSLILPDQSKNIVETGNQPTDFDQVQRDKDLNLNSKFNDYRPRKYQFEKVQKHYNIPNKKEKHQTRYEFYQTLYDLNPYKGEEKDEDDDDTKLFTKMIICKRYLQDGDKKDFLGICVAVHHTDHESMKALPKAIEVFKGAGAQLDYVDRFKIPLMILSGDQAHLQPTRRFDYLSTLQIRLSNFENGVSIHVERVKEEIEQDQNMERLLQLLAKTQQLHSKEFNHRILLTGRYQKNTTPKLEDQSTQGSDTRSYQLNSTPDSNFISTQGSDSRSERNVSQQNVSGNGGSQIDSQHNFGNNRDEEETKETKE